MCLLGSSFVMTSSWTHRDGLPVSHLWIKAVIFSYFHHLPQGSPRGGGLSQPLYLVPDIQVPHPLCPSMKNPGACLDKGQLERFPRNELMTNPPERVRGRS